MFQVPGCGKINLELLTLSFGNKYSAGTEWKRLWNGAEATLERSGSDFGTERKRNNNGNALSRAGAREGISVLTKGVPAFLITCF